jgi:ribosomal protein L37E
MDVVALNNWQEDNLLKPDLIQPKCTSIHLCTLFGYFLLRAWGIDKYHEDLKELNALSGTWRDSPSDTSCLGNITRVWKRFAHEVLINSSQYANDLASKVYTDEQIRVVVWKLRGTEPLSATGDNTSGVIASICPKCKLSYKWNGTTCSHCGYGTIH